MRRIELTTRFRRDFKREKKSQHGQQLDALLEQVVNMLAADTPLQPKYRDHPLTGQWDDHRDCHMRPDLVLIYRLPDAKRLQLVRLGSHSALGL